MTKLMANAVYCAIQWKLSIADSWGAGSPEREKALAEAETFRKVLKRGGYGEPQIDGTPISIYEIAAMADAPQPLCRCTAPAGFQICDVCGGLIK